MSEIHSKRRLLRRWYIGLPLITAPFCFLLPKQLASILNTASPKLVAEFEGRFGSLDTVFPGLCQDLWWMLAGLCAVAFVGCRLTRFLRPHSALKAGALSLYWFTTLNLFLGFAKTLPGFWAPWLVISPPPNLARFELVRLLAERHAGDHALPLYLFGNSQAQSLVDEQQINRKLNGTARLYELDFPGVLALDQLLTLERVSPHEPFLVVSIVSEMTFYSKDSGERLPLLMNGKGLSALNELSTPLPKTWNAARRYAALSRWLPLFHLRDLVGQVVLGNEREAALVRHRMYRRDSPLEAQALARAGVYQRRDQSVLQWEAYQKMAARIKEQGGRLLIVVVPLSPLLANHLDPAVVAEFHDSLKALADTHNHILLWTADSLNGRKWTADDFSDLKHGTAKTKQLFTEDLVDIINRENTPR